VYIEGARLRMARRRAEKKPAVSGQDPQPAQAPAEASLGLQRPIEGDGRA